MELVGLFSQEIPEPIAPARPVQSPVGMTIPITTSTGLSGDLDSLGNIWNKAGQYIGNVKSQSTTAQSPPVSPGPSSPPPTASTDYLKTLEKWAAGLVSDQTTGGGLSLEDLILIVLGLMLIGAAVFTFRDTQNVVKTITKTARGAADTKLAAALAA